MKSSYTLRWLRDQRCNRSYVEEQKRKMQERDRAAMEKSIGQPVKLANQPSPEPVDDFNREYDIAPWAFDDGGE